ncbi:MAG: Aldolase protein [Acidobacteria bacterium]|nr:Aldolase protein [Acidobacteriota bacterium]
MAHTDTELRKTLLEACLVLDHNRLIHAYGHVSVRSADGKTILITPRKGPALVRSPHEMLRVDLDGKPASLKPPLEIFLHTEIYRSRPDVNAICRIHGKFANVLSVLRRTLRPVHELAIPVGPEVPLFDTPELISSLEVGRRMVGALGSARALLLRGNGQLTVGTGIEEAVVNAIHLETSAEIQWRALLIGVPAWIAGDEFTGEYAKLAKREYEAILRPWEYYLHQSRAR